MAPEPREGKVKMTIKVLRPSATIVRIIALLVAALAVYMLGTTGTSHADSSFTAATDIRYCNAMPAAGAFIAFGGDINCPDDLEAGKANAYTTYLDIPSGLNFSSVVTMTPASSGTTAVSAGTQVGGLQSSTTLGVENSACDTLVPVDFRLYSVALPNMDGLGSFDPATNTSEPRDSSNIVWPRSEGDAFRFDGWNVGSNAPAGGGTVPVGSTFAAGSSLFIQNYPSYLLDLFDPDFVPGGVDGSTSPVVPLAVYGGATLVAGHWIPLFFGLFDAGGMSSLVPPLSSINANMGKPSVAVLNDPTAVKAARSSISDFCTPLSVTTTVLGNVHTNPSAGTQFLVQYNASARDADQDGYENALDPCPKVPNLGSPKVDGDTGADAEQDRIDDACDLNTSSPPFQKNGDGDVFDNAQDTCPQINDLNEDAELTTYGAAGSPDLGSRGDAIGTACDSGAVVIACSGGTTSCQNGHAVTGLTLSSTVANGRYHVRTNVIAKCFGATSAGGTDADGDGYCAADDNTPVPNTIDDGEDHADVHNTWVGTHPAAQMDTDGDGFSDAIETYMGTDAAKSCSQDGTEFTGISNEGPLDNFPLEFDDNNFLDLGDVLKYNLPFNLRVAQVTGAPPEYASDLLWGQRLDLNSDGILDLGDVLKFNLPFKKACGVDGTLASIPLWSQQ